MADSPHIVELNEQNFMQVAVEASDHTPVLVDFWAPWCEPCKTLTPLLEKLAIEYNGAFVLATLNVEEYQALAQQFGIRSMPTIKLLKERQLIGEFVGAQPESEIRKFLETHVGPAPEAEPEETEDTRVKTAMALFEQGQTEEARALLQEAQSDQPDNPEVLLALGQICISSGDLDTAESCLSAMPEEARNGLQGQRLAGTLEIAKEHDDSVSLSQLKSDLENNSGSSDARYKLAIAEALNGDIQTAMDHLLKLVQTDAEFNKGAPREKLLALFNVLGDDPLASQYRRKLFALLH